MDRGLSTDSENPSALDSSPSPSDGRNQQTVSFSDPAPAGLPGRFGTALRSVTHSFHLFQRHQVEHSAAAMAAAVVGGAAGQTQRPSTSAFRKLTGAGLLSRFRSSSKTMSDDEMEGPSARGMGVVSHPANCVKSSPILFHSSDAWQRLDQAADAKVICDALSGGRGRRDKGERRHCYAP